MRGFWKLFGIFSIALLALTALSSMSDAHGIVRKNFCKYLNEEIVVARWGQTLDVSTLDIPSVFSCDGPIIIDVPVNVDFGGRTLVVDAPHPGVVVGTWGLQYQVQHAGFENLNIIFTDRASKGMECWDNDCSKAVFGTAGAVRNNGVSVHHTRYTRIRNVKVRGGPSGGIIFADSMWSQVENAEVSEARFDGLGCNATFGVLFTNVWTHHNGHAGITSDIDGSCRFDDVVSENNGQHGIWARNTPNSITINRGTIARNGDTGIFLDRSDPGNPSTCVSRFVMHDTKVDGVNMALWEDPECYKTTHIEITNSTMRADSLACAGEALIEISPDIARACPATLVAVNGPV